MRIICAGMHMTLNSWDDIRIALTVARCGTVSGAADLLGVHHATVIRRVDALEAQFGAKLFQRHPRGYTLTEAGQMLLRIAGETDERFAQLASQISGTGDRIEGELVITSLSELAERVIPKLTGLLSANPDLRLRYVTDARLYRLSLGEAHVAIRAGGKPTEPDYVVRPFETICTPLFAAQTYLDRYGPVEDLSEHRFALPGQEANRSPIMQWLLECVPAANILLISNEFAARDAIIREGLAIGFYPGDQVTGLIKVMVLPAWEARLWLVTHVDLHRTPKVQAALAALTSAARSG